jgi:hypothetical protein
MVIPAETDLGYQFDPPCRPGHPGYRRLSAWLRAAPTQRNYDSEVVQCPVLAQSGDPEALKIEHPWRSRIRFMCVPDESY